MAVEGGDEDHPLEGGWPRGLVYTIIASRRHHNGWRLLTQQLLERRSGGRQGLAFVRIPSYRQVHDLDRRKPPEGHSKIGVTHEPIAAEQFPRHYAGTGGLLEHDSRDERAMCGIGRKAALVIEGGGVDVLSVEVDTAVQPWMLSRRPRCPGQRPLHLHQGDDWSREARRADGRVGEAPPDRASDGRRRAARNWG